VLNTVEGGIEREGLRDRDWERRGADTETNGAERTRCCAMSLCAVLNSIFDSAKRTLDFSVSILRQNAFLFAFF
jgi:hypothetical protein